jgi:hypothetical protein
MPLIDSILTVNDTTIEGRTPAVGTNTAIFLSSGADASLDGTLYTTVAAIDADESDLTAQVAKQMKAFLAAGPLVGGIYVQTYDTGSAETPSDALDAARDAGILPRWSYCYILLEVRTDAAIADAADWTHTNARGDALVVGQLSTSSILSGTKPSTVAASSGADLAVVYYDDTGENAGAETIAGAWASTRVNEDRPTAGILTPTGMPAYATELTTAQISSATDRDTGASCLVSSPLYPGATGRTVWKGYTVGGTLIEVELGVIIIRAALYQDVATLVEARSQPGIPALRTTDDDAEAIRAVIDGQLESKANAGYIERGVAADPTTGRPALPDGYLTSVTFDGQTAEANVKAAYPGDVRDISIDLTGYVS